MSLDFELVSEFTPIQRRSFPVPTVDGGGTPIINPNSTNPLILGEFLELNSAYQMVRGAANPSLWPSFAVFGERGRTDMQALGKAPMLYMGTYEAQTKVMDDTGLVVGDALEVQDVTFGSLTRRGLIEFTAGYIVGRVTRLPANNNGYLRFIRVEN
jgi:hypothetical protein